jgi:hypothetical protein
MRTKLFVIFWLLLCLGAAPLASCGPAPAKTAAVVLQTETPVPSAAATVRPEPLPTSATLPAPEPTADQADTQATIVAAFRSVSQLSHRSESTVVFADGNTITTTVEFAPPDKKHFFQSDSETIVVANRVYNRKKGEGEWTELQVAAEQFSYPSFGEDLGAIQFLGQEDLEGASMLVYKASLANEQTATTSILTVWISPNDGLLYRLVNDGEVGAFDSSTGKLKMVKAITTSVFAYDPSIQVAGPIE